MCRCKYTGPERWGSNSDPSINGHLHYPNDLDGPLNEAAADKIRAYRADYNNRPSNAISFIPAIASTVGRLHCECVHLLFLQAHQETDRFFAAWGVQLAQSNNMYHYRRVAFSSQLKSKVGHILAKAAALRIHLNIDGLLLLDRYAGIRAHNHLQWRCPSMVNTRRRAIFDRDGANGVWHDIHHFKQR